MPPKRLFLHRHSTHGSNPHALSPIAILHTKAQWLLFLALCLIVFLGNLALEYSHYRALDSDTPIIIHGQVIAQYTKTSPKTNQPYEVLKVRTESGEIFYTTSKEDIKNLLHAYVRIYGKSAKCSFWQYLQSCLITSFSLSLESTRDYRNSLRTFIDSQHTDSLLGAFYKTLYIADFLPKELRDISNTLGIAHLIAISGFHLGILSLVLGFSLGLIYKRVHRFFPYRNSFFDIGFITIVVLFGYLVLLSFSPSFLRAWVMACIGFVMVYQGIKILHFSFLFMVGILCISFFPRLLFSIGFFLSFFGVFYIYLFLHYFTFSSRSLVFKFVLFPIMFNIIIFANMLILVHFFFPYFSLYTIISIPLTLVFTIFFPASVVAHLLGFGGIFDVPLHMLFSLNLDSIEVFAPIWLFVSYLTLSLLAMRYITAYIASLFLSFGFWGYLYYSLWVA
ncbi:ComEC/Rec2 family competence protein [uncultured Helicobacter sp.]|uniref:ComEC/Rec2 family competence protein n=1 Tax=uncultured Helicobacter sp. TaxID=175537 RepID=UPI00374E2245